MSAIRAIFWDVGGVLLSNAWDRTQRTMALEHFHLDEAEFHDRHEMVVSSAARSHSTNILIARSSIARGRLRETNSATSCTHCRSRFLRCSHSHRH